MEKSIAAGTGIAMTTQLPAQLSAQLSAHSTACILFGVISGISLYRLWNLHPEICKSSTIRSYQGNAEAMQAEVSKNAFKNGDKVANSDIHDVIVVGLGGHGSSILAQLAVKGLRVLGIER
jgi:hypothetical protein